MEMSPLQEAQYKNAERKRKLASKPQRPRTQFLCFRLELNNNYLDAEDGNRYMDALEAENKILRELVEELRPKHYWCDDSFYSCPCAPDFYDNVDPDAKCNCKADAVNAKVDAALDGIGKGE